MTFQRISSIIGVRHDATDSIECAVFTLRIWKEMRKDRFGDVMRRWCTRHGFIQKMNDGKEIMTKLPYRICKGGSCVECAKDFIELANKNLLNLAIEN